MKSVSPGTAMVSAFVVLVGVSAAYMVHRWTRVEDGPKSLKMELAEPAGSSLRSPTPMPLPADDQAETILQRILRGTGIAGLAGMRRFRPLGPAATLIRPLLDFRRAEIVGYLADLGQPYRSDSSNDDLRFTRNRIRRQLLPQLAEQFNPAVTEALVRLGLLAGEVQEIIGRQVEELADRAVAETGRHGVKIRTDALAAQPRYLVRELVMTLWRRQQWPLQAMGFQEWDLLADMLLAPLGLETLGPCKRTFPGGVEAELREGVLRISGPTTES